MRQLARRSLFKAVGAILIKAAIPGETGKLARAWVGETITWSTVFEQINTLRAMVTIRAMVKKK